MAGKSNKPRAGRTNNLRNIQNLLRGGEVGPRPRWFVTNRLGESPGPLRWWPVLRSGNFPRARPLRWAPDHPAHPNEACKDNESASCDQCRVYRRKGGIDKILFSSESVSQCWHRGCVLVIGRARFWRALL